MKKFKRSALTVGTSTLLITLAACGTNNEADTEAGNNGGSDNSEENEEVAEDYPHDPVTFVVPFDAGGSVDGMARGVANHLDETLDTTINIDNRPGASAQIGASHFINAPDDGSTYFAGTQLYLSANIVLQDADFDIEDFSMVNFEQFDPVTITVHENSPYETFEDLLEDIENNPGEISYTTIYGGPLHLTGVLLEDYLDVDLNPVFYDGGGEMRNALLGEHVDFMIGNANGDKAVEDNVRVLAVADDDMEELWPDAPPINDVLQDNYDVEIPYVGSARFIAAHTSFKEENPELFDQFVNAYEEMFNSEEYQAYLEESGADAVSEFRGPEESDEMNLELHELMLEYQDELAEDEDQQ
ncbi:Bug family tripartite tricarboxylate transporter substrate binding protein [Alkalicoccus saliphilus]|uniref:Bug family tripartite tricarboxylate transporter substrate binding protein n=1 Tax=Alkalicoccus saliphilus TaxID=200989 RepID=UPI00135CACA5|nr:tripartite tricarboxylate transporter substrate binding protein [Alkalicoccus saliphilus]